MRIGTPWFQEVTIHLEDGKSFCCSCRRAFGESVLYSVTRGERSGAKHGLSSHEELSKGGSMSFTLGVTARHRIGELERGRTPEVAADSSIVINPGDPYEWKVARDSMTISISAAAGDTILYQWMGSTLKRSGRVPDPHARACVYHGPPSP